jgi:hypothetical protein
MGWKGAVRSINAEMKRQVRENERQHRQHLKEVKREEAFAVVEEQQVFLEQIVSLHQYCRANFDWKAIENEEEPKEPKNTQPLTQAAEAKLNNFKPNIIDNVFKTAEWRKKRLIKKAHDAKYQDQQDYTRSLADYECRKKTWEKNQDLAKRLKTDDKAVLEALQEHLGIEDLPIGQDVQFEIFDNMQVDINLKVMPMEKVIPEEEYSLRQSGTLSIKKMPKGKALELYQDHICSALIRIARETLGVVPLEMVRANALMNAVNTQTGHLEEQVILSALIPRDALDKLNLSYIDPSDSLVNFIHTMKFKKTKGFEAVEKIDFPQKHELDT